jgi:hypothetical protein
MIVCEYKYSATQPVGESQNKFRRMTEVFIRSGNYIQISDEWNDVQKRMKEDVWDALVVCFN